jgi:hypothetical protein
VFHKVSPYEWTTGIHPGDMVICHSTLAYHVDEFYERTPDTRALLLAHRPVLILAVIPGDPSVGFSRTGQYDDCSETKTIRTFVLLTRHGILITSQPVKDGNELR